MLKPADFVKNYLLLLKNVIDKVSVNDLAEIIVILEGALEEKRQVFLAGNGGSAATAGHMANDLMLGVAKKQLHGFRAISLADHVAPISALANDTSYAEIFSGQLRQLATKDDLLIVISASGNSPNIVRALEEATVLGMQTIAFLGMSGGRAAEMADKSIIVSSNEYGPIEDLHMIFDHLITGYFQQ
jgi:D-sedoheptulose 7-phosphate isomerase